MQKKSEQANIWFKSLATSFKAGWLHVSSELWEVKAEGGVTRTHLQGPFTVANSFLVVAQLDISLGSQSSKTCMYIDRIARLLFSKLFSLIKEGGSGFFIGRQQRTWTWSVLWTQRRCTGRKRFFSLELGWCTKASCLEAQPSRRCKTAQRSCSLPERTLHYLCLSTLRQRGKRCSKIAPGSRQLLEKKFIREKNKRTFCNFFPPPPF